MVRHSALIHLSRFQILAATITVYAGDFSFCVYKCCVAFDPASVESQILCAIVTLFITQKCMNSPHKPHPFINWIGIANSGPKAPSRISSWVGGCSQDLPAEPCAWLSRLWPGPFKNSKPEKVCNAHPWKGDNRDPRPKATFSWYIIWMELLQRVPPWKIRCCKARERDGTMKRKSSWRYNVSFTFLLLPLTYHHF